MEPQNQEIVASGSPAEVPNDPGWVQEYHFKWNIDFSTERDILSKNIYRRLSKFE